MKLFKNKKLEINELELKIKELEQTITELDKECSRLEKKEVEMLKEIEQKDKVIDELKEYMKNVEHNYQVAIKETIHRSKIQNLINKIIKEENYCINNFDKLFGQETNTIDEKVKMHNYLTCQQELSAIRGMIEELLEE